MSLLEALEAGPQPYRACKLADWLDKQDPKVADTVKRSILTQPYRWMARVLTANGYQVSPSTINNHKMGACVSCRSWTGAPT